MKYMMIIAAVDPLSNIQQQVLPYLNSAMGKKDEALPRLFLFSTLEIFPEEHQRKHDIGKHQRH